MLRTSITNLAKTGQKSHTNNPRILPRVGTMKKKNKGLRALPGDSVERNAWLVRQSLTRTVYWPGQHVKANVHNDLLADVAGRVEVTKEIYIPHPTSVDAEIVKKMPRGSLWFRQYVNIVPKDSQNDGKGEFRLKALL